MTRRILWCLAFGLLHANAAWAVDFFIAPNGNDAWSGQLVSPNDAKTDGPFATPARARLAVQQLRQVAKLVGPVRVILRGGRYELPEPLVFTPEDSASERSPNIWLAAEGEKPILSGGVAVRPKVEGGLWVIDTPGEVGQVPSLAVGDEYRSPSRWPKQGFFTISGLAGADPKASYRTPANRFEFAPGQIDAAWKNLQDVEVLVLHFWVDGHYRVQSVDGEKRVVALDRSSVRKFTEDHGAKPARFYLRNVPVDLEPGEFYHDRAAKQIRYRPKTGETLETHAVVIPRLPSVMRIDGQPDAGQTVEHLQFQGITFRDSMFDIGSKSAGDLQAAQHVPGAVRFKGARHCAVRNCQFSNLGGYGIELLDGCRENRIERSDFSRLAAGGIRLSGGNATSPEARRTGNNVIADNSIHDLGLRFHAGIGILCQHADHNIIQHNHIHHLDYSAISVGWVWGYAPSVSAGNIIEGNRIHDVGRKILSDMGGIYMLGQAPGTIVRGNVLHDIQSFGYGGWGIYTDEGSSDVLIEKNLVYRTKSGGFHQHYGKENIVRNNIFALAQEGQLMRSKAEPHISFTLERNIVFADSSPLYAKNWKDDQFRTDYNLFWDASGKSVSFPGGSLKEWQARGHDVHSLVADPQFENPAQGDFRLKPGSPALKLGFEPFDFSKAGIRRDR